MIRNIVVPLFLSEASLSALQLGTETAIQNNATIHLVSVFKGNELSENRRPDNRFADNLMMYQITEEISLLRQKKIPCSIKVGNASFFSELKTIVDDVAADLVIFGLSDWIDKTALVSFWNEEIIIDGRRVIFI